VEGCVEYQSYELDILPLVRWAKAVGIRAVVGKPLKLPRKGACDKGLHASLKPAFPTIRGSYWRMQMELQNGLVSDMRRLCAEHGLQFEHCMHNILMRNKS
jgi:hypothetical protein